MSCRFPNRTDFNLSAQHSVRTNQTVAPRYSAACLTFSIRARTGTGPSIGLFTEHGSRKYEPSVKEGSRLSRDWDAYDGRAVIPDAADLRGRFGVWLPRTAAARIDTTIALMEAESPVKKLASVVGRYATPLASSPVGALRKLPT
jgi:hypothetical protein